MKTKEILTNNPEVISPDAGLIEAAQRMKKQTSVHYQSATENGSSE